MSSCDGKIGEIDMEQTYELYFDGILKECTLKNGRNGDRVLESEDGFFLIVPKDVDIEERIMAHNDVNGVEVEVVHDVEYGEVVINS